jgi:hypothetical protein
MVSAFSRCWPRHPKNNGGSGALSLDAAPAASISPLFGNTLRHRLHTYLSAALTTTWCKKRAKEGQKGQARQNDLEKEQQTSTDSGMALSLLTTIERLPTALLAVPLGNQRPKIESGLGGTRTHSQRLKRALLYH